MVLNPSFLEGVEDVLHFCSRCVALKSKREDWKNSVLSLCDKVEIPSQFLKAIAKVALSDLCEEDVFKLLLCNWLVERFRPWSEFKRAKAGDSASILVNKVQQLASDPGVATLQVMKSSVRDLLPKQKFGSGSLAPILSLEDTKVHG